MAFKVNNNIVIDDSRNLVNIEAASLAGILTASEIQTAENGDISVGAGGSITSQSIYVKDANGNISGVATITDGGVSNFKGLVVEGSVEAGKFVGVGSELTYLSSASITTSVTPVARLTGEPLQDGDLWFDTSAELGGVRQYTYFDAQWIDSNAAPILSNLVVKNGETSDEIAFDGGSLDILGGTNISVALAGVGSTATFTANLDERISLTGMELSGIATMATMKFGETGQEVTSIVTDLTGATDADLPTAGAVNSSITAVQGDISNLEGDLSNLQLDVSNLDLVNFGDFTASGVATFSAQVKAEGPGIGLTVSNGVYVGGGIEAAGALEALSLNFSAGSEASVSDILTSTGDIELATDAQLITAAAAKGAIDAVQSSLDSLNIIELERIEVAGVSTFKGQAKADAAGIGLTVADSAYIGGTLELGGAATLQGQVKAEAAGIGLTVADSAYMGGALEVNGAATLGSLTVEGATEVQSLTVKGDLTVENTATQINFNVKDVAVDDRLIELGTEDGAAPTVATSHDLGISLNYNDGAAKRSALVWSNNAAFNLAAEITDDGADDVNITIAAHADLGVGALYMGDAETAGNLAIDASKNATLADISASGNFTFGGTAFSAVETSLTGAADAIPTAQAVFNYVETATESVGTASSITLTEDASTDDTYYIPFAPDATGDTQLRTDSSQLKYNPSTGTLTAQVVDTLSDIRYKENIELISEPLAKVEALRGVNFDWIGNDSSSAGIIAQEVKAVMPNLITEHGEMITVNYNGLVGLLIEAVKELSAEVSALKAAE